MYLEQVLFAVAPTQFLSAFLALAFLPPVEAARDLTGPEGTPEGLNRLLS